VYVYRQIENSFKHEAAVSKRLRSYPGEIKRSPLLSVISGLVMPISL
jgi:hypothetical protein